MSDTHAYTDDTHIALRSLSVARESRPDTQSENSAIDIEPSTASGPCTMPARRAAFAWRNAGSAAARMTLPGWLTRSTLYQSPIRSLRGR